MTTATPAPVPPSVGSEAANCTFFDTVMGATDLFTAYPEVPGTLIQPRPGQIVKGMRIDRILVPSQKLLDLGWSFGIIGIELKAHGVKAGPALAQAMDYTRAAFTLPGSKFQVVPSWVFVYPLDKAHGPLASLMAQNRVGTASTDRWTLLALRSGEANVLRVSVDGTVRVGNASFGTKAGSR